jgi:hypothetical protein
MISGGQTTSSGEQYAQVDARVIVVRSSGLMVSRADCEVAGRQLIAGAGLSLV